MVVKSVEYLEMGDRIKIVIQTKKSGFEASLCLRGEIFFDSFNIEEPFDRKTHVFYIEKDKLKNNDKLVLKKRVGRIFKRRGEHSFDYSPVFANEAELKKQYDNGVEAVKTEKETVADGVIYTHYICKDKNGAPVNAFTLEVDPKKASLYIGTPNDGYESVNVKAKVPDMIAAAVKNGVPVVAAMNADFFDIFGDCHPSGLCVKNSVVVANGNSERPFIGIKKDGTPVITDIVESEGIVAELSQAAAGLQMIVKDGEMFDFAPLEPFSFVRHPRTAAGIKKDGTIILLDVDGRIPEYSNGASLVDLAKLMIDLGADRAINLDGGGSSIVYTKKGEDFILRSNPADLFRPRAKLIRKEFDALLVVKK